MNTQLSVTACVVLLAGVAAGIAGTARSGPSLSAGSPGGSRPAAAEAAAGARVPDDITARVGTLIAESGGKIVGDSIGSSRQGRTLHVLRIGDASRPAILIAAGLNAQHRVGIDAALGVAKKLTMLSGTPEGAGLDRVCVYVLPCADPDGVERERAAGAPRREGARNPAPVDDDGDARVDEDGPIDLNGDGVIGVMRVPDPSPRYAMEATELRDPAEPRLTRRADRSKGERPEYAILIEGTDQDGDGRIAEDGPDGADFSRNFPYHWPEFQSGAGPYALSEPETRAIAEWVLRTPNLVGVVVYGMHDNLVNVPEAGKFDQTNRVPTGIENEDKGVWEEVSKVFKEATGMTGAPAGDSAGTLHGWTYGFLGIWSFSTPVWVRPDLVKSDAPAVGGEAQPGGERGRRGGEGGRAGRDESPDEGAGSGTVEGAGGGAGGAPGPMSDAEVSTMIERFRTATPQQRREMMTQALSLPQETQDKLRAAAMAAFAGGVPDVAPATAATITQPVAGQPAPAQPAAGGQPDGPRGPRGGAGGPAGGPRGGRGGRGGFPPAGGAPGSDAGPRGGAGSAAPASDADDAKWLKYSDDKREKTGFMEFKPFEHPQLGTVEIGGFAPGFKVNPPGAEQPALVDQQAKFIMSLVDRLPRLLVEEPWVEEVGGGLWRIGVRVSNEGSMPTRSAVGLKARRLPPIRVVLDMPEDAVLVGQRTVRITSLAGNGGSRTVEWTVVQPGGGEARVSIKSAEFGEQSLVIPLRATPRKQRLPAPPSPSTPTAPVPPAASDTPPPAEAPPAAVPGQTRPPGEPPADPAHSEQEEGTR